MMTTAETHVLLSDARRRMTARDAAIVRVQVAVSEIAAPTGEEQRRAAWIARRFTALGLSDIRSDAAGNVIGRRRGVRALPAVAVCAHLDTVFPRGTAVRVRQDGELLLGPGIGDNGRGLAAMLALAEEIDGVRLQTDRPIDFVATTGEEGTGDLRGAKAFFRSREDVAAAIALDGAGDERIVHRGLGSRRYRIVYRGPGGHSWAAFGVVNPVHAAGTAIAKLASIIVPREPRTTLSVGRVGGGIAVNAIADEAWLEVDLRSTTVRMLDRYEREVRLAVRAAEIEENARRATGSPPLSCAVETIGDRPCGDVPADHPLVLSAIDATRLIGREPELSTASTDANVPISLGVPAIAIGAGGRGGDAHTPGEWFDNTSGTIGLARALTIVVAAAGLA
ncbi:MAG TPA: M20/M25/M40 family metallo-hydrolase [Gemmatimonadaceae bacterium]|jgi:acetylornithine deacetylase/succinyl-diaminopimelate desuccinylase-like protein|nr:M20/M25/M40 family metallo-hydrolase [Gemmatimonadaceae bacterium]